MRLLYILSHYNQHESATGFMVNWVETSKKYFQSVKILCLYKDENINDENIICFKGQNSLHTLIKLNQYLIKYKDEYDVIFTQMSATFPIASILPKFIYSKKIFMWWSHAHLNNQLKLAHFLVDGIFTASQGSFPINSPKVHIIGHGIPTYDFFKKYTKKNTLSIISIGRITEVKNYLPLIKAIKKLENLNIRVLLYGGTHSFKDETYKNMLKDKINALGLNQVISFEGEIPNSQILKHLEQNDVFINTQYEGGVGKAVLESMMIGIPAIVASPSYYVDNISHLAHNFVFEKDNIDDLANKIKSFYELDLSAKIEVSTQVQNFVRTKYSLDFLWSKIFTIITKVSHQ